MRVEQGPWDAAPGSLAEYRLPAQLVADPRQLHERTAAHALWDLTQQLAPGAASADWQAFPAESSSSGLPPMLRVGVSGNILPVLVPGPSIGDLVIGNPKLLHESVATDPIDSLTPGRTMSLGQRQRTKAAIEIAVAEQNDRRLKELREEQRVAADISLSLATRAVAAVRPGNLRLLVCAPNQFDAYFGAFEGMGDRFEHYPTGALSKMIEVLEQTTLEQTGDTVLGEHYSLRDFVLAEGSVPVPFTMAIILASERHLSASDARSLDTVLSSGRRAGISTVIHGIKLQQYDALYRLQPLRSGGWGTTAAPGLKIDLDTPPSQTVIRTAAGSVPRRRAPTAPGGIAEADAHPDAVYRDFLVRRQSETAVLRSMVTDYTKNHPLLTPKELRNRIGPSLAGYRELLDSHLMGGVREITDLRKQVLRGDVTGTLMAWAAVNLLNADPKNRLATAAILALNDHVPSRIHPHLAALRDIVTTTRLHGTEAIPEALRPHVEQYLPYHPPAWAFQILADEVTPSRFRQPDPATARAVYGEVEHTFDVQLLDARGEIIDHPLAVALAECRLLQLYDFTSAAPELQTLLTRRSHRRLEQVDPDILPARARVYYDACMAHLNNTGRIPNAQERVAGWAGAAAAGVRRAAAAGLASLKKNGETDTSPSGNQTTQPS